ncbi:hypothetical protein DFQ26_000137 [Actinomortierella ambigua]|nr:hypothetical protein DFQ26_000137 [Actinomortierella ambigua]
MLRNATTFMFHNTTISTTFALFCLVGGEATSTASSAKAPPSETIGDRRELVNAEIPDTLNGVDAKNLTLWRVSIPTSEDDDETSILVENLISDHKKKLSPLTRLIKVFPEEQPKETVNIIVQRPSLHPHYIPQKKRIRIEEDWESLPHRMDPRYICLRRGSTLL